MTERARQRDNRETCYQRKSREGVGVKILDTIQYGSGIPPCFSCGRHQKCSIGGLYGAIGKAAHTLEIKPEHFRRWESLPDIEAAIETAGEKLRSL